MFVCLFLYAFMHAYTVFEATGLTVSEENTEIMLLRTQHQMVVEAADNKGKQTNRFIYVGSVIDRNANIRSEIEKRV